MVRESDGESCSRVGQSSDGTTFVCERCSTTGGPGQRSRTGVNHGSTMTPIVPCPVTTFPPVKPKGPKDRGL